MKRGIVDVGGVPPSQISNAVMAGNQYWIDGQLSVGDYGTGVTGTAREEAGRVFAHVFRIAEAAGFFRSDIIYVDLAFIDMDDVKEVNAVCASLVAEGH